MNGWRGDYSVVLSDSRVLGSGLVSVANTGLIKISAGWGVCVNYLSQLISLIELGLFSTQFRWFCYFTVVGYNYNFRSNRRLGLLSIHVGLFYRIVIIVPKGIKIKVGKRKLFVVGQNLPLIKLFGRFVRNLRNLLPYSTRGIVYRNEKTKFKAVKKK